VETACAGAASALCFDPSIGHAVTRGPLEDFGLGMKLGFQLLNCVSGVCSDLEIQQVVKQFSYMSKNYFLVFLYS
jgi:hypothetical protein